MCTMFSRREWRGQREVFPGQMSVRKRKVGATAFHRSRDRFRSARPLYLCALQQHAVTAYSGDDKQ